MGDETESLVSVPGDSTLSSSIGGEVRGGICYDNKTYWVVGNKFYRVDGAGTATEIVDTTAQQQLGTHLIAKLNTSSGPVSMAHNGLRDASNQEIMIVDGQDGWIFDKGGGPSFTEIVDGDFVDTESVVFIERYFMF